jgi:hypothetical protein
MRSIRIYPGKLIGFQTPYNAEFVNVIKALPLKMWDSAGKVWWVPDSYWTVVRNAGLQFNVLLESEVKRFEKPFPTSAGPRDPYAVLSLQPNAPMGLVVAAYRFWQREYESAGGLGTQLAEVEEAYATITRGGV